MFIPFKLDYSGYRIIRQKDRFTASIRTGTVLPVLPPWVGDTPLPDTLYWPDLQDTDGVKRLIDSVINANLPVLRDFSVLFPQFNFGIGMYVELLTRAAEQIKERHGVNPIDQVAVAPRRYPEPIGSKAKVKYPLSSWDMVDGMRGEAIYYLWDDPRGTESIRINIWADQPLGKPLILTRIGSSLDSKLLVVLEDHPGRYRALGLPRGPLDRLLTSVRADTIGPCSTPRALRQTPPSKQPAPSSSRTSRSRPSLPAIGG